VNRPHRRHRLVLELEADTWNGIKANLRHILYEMDGHPDGRMSSVMGGAESGYILKCTVDPNMDADRYARELEAYLDAQKAASTGDAK
jgi:hypothetical protein